MTVLRWVLLVASFLGSVGAFSDAQAWHIPFVSKSKAPPEAPQGLSSATRKDTAASTAARTALRTKQFDAALRDLQGAAEQGDTQSQYLLGLVYANGVGTDASPELARRWLAMAGDKSYVEAAFALSGLLAEGTAQERAEAQRWLTRAASLGHPVARKLVAAHSLPLAPSHDPNGNAGLARELLLWTVRKDDVADVDAFAKVAGIDAADEFGRTALGYAAVNGSLQMIRHLIGAGAQATHPDQFGVTPLMMAAEARDDPQILDALLQASQDKVDARDQGGNSALNYAARVGRMENLQKLLAAGAGVGGENSDGWTVLDVASKAGHPEMAQVLRRAGATGRIKAALVKENSGLDVGHGGELYAGWQPLAIAVSRNDARIVGELLASGARADEPTPRGDTPLLVAVKYHAPAVIADLLRTGANPAQAGEADQTALCYATAHADVEVIDALLQKGVSPNTHARDEDPPIVIAARSDNETLVRRLVDAGADVNAVSAQGVSAAMIASGGSDPEVLRALIAAKANLALRDKTGRDALWVASNSGNEAAIDQLLAAGAPIETAMAGQSALFAAVRGGKVSTLERLLRKGLAPNARDSAGNTPLIAAAARGDLTILKVLLDGGAQINAQNAAGNTALIVASREGHAAICKALLQAGATASLRNQERHDALDTAKRRNLTQIVALLTGE
ncbi:MAG TPA: ankyrin repeat domain-containing protein [Steroidobacteraceae bacterium]|jgi:ankyrin repeat protein